MKKYTLYLKENSVIIVLLIVLLLFSGNVIAYDNCVKSEVSYCSKFVNNYYISKYKISKTRKNDFFLSPNAEMDRELYADYYAQHIMQSKGICSYGSEIRSMNKIPEIRYARTMSCYLAHSQLACDPVDYEEDYNNDEDHKMVQPKEALPVLCRDHCIIYLSTVIAYINDNNKCPYEFPENYAKPADINIVRDEYRNQIIDMCNLFNNTSTEECFILDVEKYRCGFITDELAKDYCRDVNPEDLCCIDFYKSQTQILKETSKKNPLIIGSSTFAVFAVIGFLFSYKYIKEIKIAEEKKKREKQNMMPVIKPPMNINSLPKDNNNHMSDTNSNTASSYTGSNHGSMASGNLVNRNMNYVNSNDRMAMNKGVDPKQPLPQINIFSQLNNRRNRSGSLNTFGDGTRNYSLTRNPNINPNNNSRNRNESLNAFRDNNKNTTLPMNNNHHNNDDVLNKSSSLNYNMQYNNSPDSPYYYNYPSNNNASIGSNSNNRNKVITSSEVQKMYPRTSSNKDDNDRYSRFSVSNASTSQQQQPPQNYKHSSINSGFTNPNNVSQQQQQPSNLRNDQEDDFSSKDSKPPQLPSLNFNNQPSPYSPSLQQQQNSNDVNYQNPSHVVSPNLDEGESCDITSSTHNNNLTMDELLLPMNIIDQTDLVETLGNFDTTQNIENGTITSANSTSTSNSKPQPPSQQPLIITNITTSTNNSLHHTNTNSKEDNIKTNLSSDEVTTNLLRNGSSHTTTTTTTDKTTFSGLYDVVKPFFPNKYSNDDLRVVPGMIMRILVKNENDDFWVYAQNVETGEKGNIPINCLTQRRS